MSAVYFHIPFCKQACHYCNFHFSTSVKYKTVLLEAMRKEVELRKDELPKVPLDSIYFGGGTPSLLSQEEISSLISTVTDYFELSNQVEITLEMNPDDYHAGYFEEIKAAGINRVSIGVQSFMEGELNQMNRAHTAMEAYTTMREVKNHFDNFSMDLIYGMPGSDLPSWERNVALALGFNPPHISSYALTVEPKTALVKQVENKEIKLLPEELVVAQFDYLVKMLTEEGYDHYELSNFGLPGYHSINNTAYWQRKPYLGIGPSAHSYYQAQRSWNIANNKRYVDRLKKGKLPIEREQLTKIDQYNEFVMTGLRTSAGVALYDLQNLFGAQFAELFEKQVEKHLANQNLYWDGDVVKVAQKAKFLVDGIASDLFLLNL